MNPHKYIEKYGNEIVDLAIAYKEDHITKEEFKELLLYSRIFLYMQITRFKTIYDIFAITMAIKSIEFSFSLVMTQPKRKQDFNTGGLAVVGEPTEDEAILLPDGKLMKPANKGINWNEILSSGLDKKLKNKNQ